MLKKLRPVLPIVLLFLLLTEPQTACSGAKYGLLLWYSVILPTLFPFMLCSGLLSMWGGVPVLMKPFAPIRSLLKLSSEGSYCLLTGLLCGCPMGAKTIVDYLRKSKISPREGRRLLVLSGCPSPMFLSGYVRFRLPDGFPYPLFLLSLYLPLLLIGICTRGVSSGFTSGDVDDPNAEEDLLINSLEIMVKIGICLMLYSILVSFIEALPTQLIPLFPKCALLALTEITTGIDYAGLHLSGLSSVLLLLFSSAFGGISCITQIQAVIHSCSQEIPDSSDSIIKDSTVREKNAGLSIRHYVRWKLIHASLSCVTLILLLLLQQLPHPPLPR